MAMRKDYFNPICKICYSFGGSNGKDRLVESPCKCMGSMGLVHVDCLTKWLNVSATTSCEICQRKYNFGVHSCSSGSRMSSKCIVLFVTVLSICVGLNQGFWEVESMVDCVLWFVAKVLMASVFVDWLFPKLWLQSETENAIVLYLKK